MNLIGVKVDEHAKMNLDDLDKHLETCYKQGRAVYTVVAVMGSTEEGAVDPLQALQMAAQDLLDRVHRVLRGGVCVGGR